MEDLSAFLPAANAGREGFGPRLRGRRGPKVFVRPGYEVMVESAGEGEISVEAIEVPPHAPHAPPPRAAGRVFACGELSTGYQKLCEAFAGRGGMTAAIKPLASRMYLFVGKGEGGNFVRLDVAVQLQSRTPAEARVLDACRGALWRGAGAGGAGAAGAGEDSPEEDLSEE